MKLPKQTRDGNKPTNVSNRETGDKMQRGINISIARRWKLNV